MHGERAMLGHIGVAVMPCRPWHGREEKQARQFVPALAGLAARPRGQLGYWASWPGLAAGLGSFVWFVGPRPGPQSGVSWAGTLKPKTWALSPIDKNTIDKIQYKKRNKNTKIKRTRK